jgi:mevalonate kinase
MGDHLHKLLKKQIRKYFTPECLKEEKIQRFLDAVNISYQAYDRDLALSNHAFNSSEQEYRDINHRLREEITLKEKGLSNLKELIRTLGPHDEPVPGRTTI